MESIVLVMVGITGLIFFLYIILVWGERRPGYQYSPADIVYGETIYAVHDMDGSNKFQPLGLMSVNSTKFPEIQLTEKYYDFGEVYPRQVLTHTFVIANSGQSRLIIQRAYTTCGCTTADITAAEIPPGKVVLMTLHFDTGYHDMRGTTVRRGVMIETNDPYHPSQEIWIQASI